MRWIRKGQEPKAWAAYRIAMPRADFDDAPKGELRPALLAEQGYLCCYCMCRIDADTTRIEHRLPQDPHSPHYHQRFHYPNLLAACQGGEGLGRELEHCDVHKKNQEISFDPAHPSRSIEDLVSYSGSGEIDAKDEAIRKDLHTVLNLNLPWLKEARQEVLTGFLAGFERKHAKDWTIPVLERELKKWSTIPPGGKLTAYAGIVVDYLRKRLRRAAAR